MNHFDYEFRGKEKLRELIEDGLNNQALHRSGAARHRLFAYGMKLSLGLLAGLGLIAALVAR
jgi:hypothetical protein